MKKSSFLELFKSVVKMQGNIASNLIPLISMEVLGCICFVWIGWIVWAWHCGEWKHRLLVPDHYIVIQEYYIIYTDYVTVIYSSTFNSAPICNLKKVLDSRRMCEYDAKIKNICHRDGFRVINEWISIYM